MKRAGVVGLMLILSVSMTGCSKGKPENRLMDDLKNVQAKVEHQEEGDLAAAGKKSGSGQGEAPEGAAAKEASSGGAPSGGTASGSGENSVPGQTKRPALAGPEDAGAYWDRLEEEWKNAPEEGYVWTITIHDAQVMDFMGLVTATYQVDLSCSHVGPDMYGVYSGEYAMEYDADLSGLGAVLTATGGSFDYDGSGWMKNSRFLMDLAPYQAQDEKDFEETVSIMSEDESLSAEEQAVLDAYMGDILAGMKKEDQEFEKQDAAGMWIDWNMQMTEGDMSGYFNAVGIISGTTDVSSSVDSSGKHAEADAHTQIYLIGEGGVAEIFNERYNVQEDVENPIPYSIKAYEDGNAVMTFYSGSGGPGSVKCYGTIDKIPVGETQRINP